MTHYGLPALHGLMIWWVSTCLILFLDGLPKHTFRWSMSAATVLVVAALYALRSSSADTSVAGAYTAFTAAVLIWGWLEMSFYMGYITGPRTHRCAAGCSGWGHFGHAVQASLYHEMVVLLLACLVAEFTRGGANQFGTWTFIILWWMHQSARLNVFLGVPNCNPEFLPEHLDHIRGFLTRKPMNVLFPVSVTLSTIGAVLLVQLARESTDKFHATGYTLLATMMVLAILEHWILVLPISALRMWNGMWTWSIAWRGERAVMTKRHHPVAVAREATIGGGP